MLAYLRDSWLEHLSLIFLAVNLSRMAVVAVCTFDEAADCDCEEEGAVNSMRLEESVCCGGVRRIPENNVSDSFFRMEKRPLSESWESALTRREISENADAELLLLLLVLLELEASPPPASTIMRSLLTVDAGIIVAAVVL
jgi:hypothetical protein